MKVQELNYKKNKVNFKSHLWEPNHFYKFTDAAACDRNTMRIFANEDAREIHSKKLASIDKLIPPKGWVGRVLNKIIKKFIPVPREAQMESTTIVVDELGRRIKLHSRHLILLFVRYRI